MYTNNYICDVFKHFYVCMYVVYNYMYEYNIMYNYVYLCLCAETDPGVLGCI